MKKEKLEVLKSALYDLRIEEEEREQILQNVKEKKEQQRIIELPYLRERYQINTFFDSTTYVESRNLGLYLSDSECTLRIKYLDKVLAYYVLSNEWGIAYGIYPGSDFREFRYGESITTYAKGAERKTEIPRNILTEKDYNHVVKAFMETEEIQAFRNRHMEGVKKILPNFDETLYNPFLEKIGNPQKKMGQK